MTVLIAVVAIGSLTLLLATLLVIAVRTSEDQHAAGSQRYQRRPGQAPCRRPGLMASPPDVGSAGHREGAVEPGPDLVGQRLR